MAVVLIVEDDEQVRMLAESILQDAGHETRSAATMTEAHAIYGKHCTGKQQPF